MTVRMAEGKKKGAENGVGVQRVKEAQFALMPCMTIVTSCLLSLAKS